MMRSLVYFPVLPWLETLQLDSSHHGGPSRIVPQVVSTPLFPNLHTLEFLKTFLPPVFYRSLLIDCHVPNLTRLTI